MNEKYYGEKPVGQVFMKCVMPSVFSMLFSSLYGIVDGYFVGNYIGNHALASINISMPFLMMSFAMADMIAIGSSVKISQFLGEGNEKQASETFSASMLLVFTLSAIFGSGAILFSNHMQLFIREDAQLCQDVSTYLRVFGYFSVGFIPLMAVDNYLRICGKVKLSMYLNISTSLLNIVLDYILIKQLGWGIGAAAATSGVSASLGTLYALTVFYRKKVTLRFTKPKIKWKMLVQIMYNGSSDFFGKIAGSVVGVYANSLLLRFGGAVAVSAYGIVMYLDGMLKSMLYGTIDSLQPPISYNLGAKKLDRVQGLFKITMRVGFVGAMIMFVLFITAPSFFVKIFTKNAPQASIDMAVQALILFAPSYLFTWFNTFMGSFLTSIDRPKESLVLMMLLSVVFPSLLMMTLPQIWHLNGLFLTPFISETLTFACSFYYWKKIIRKVR